MNELINIVTTLGRTLVIMNLITLNSKVVIKLIKADVTNIDEDDSYKNHTVASIGY